MSAQPDTDRSLNADKPEPQTKAEAESEALKTLNLPPMTNAAPNVTPSNASQSPATAGAPNGIQDVSALSREQLEARVKTLTESLASANTEAEAFRQQWQDLRLRDEALGVEALTKDESKLEDKVVQAVKEAYQTEMKRREAVQLLSRLLDTTGKMLETAPNFDPKVRADYEVACRAAREYLAGHSGSMIPLGNSIADAQIASVDPDRGAVILNVGKNQGVKEGMVFVITQDNQAVGMVKVSLARELVSTAQVMSVQGKASLKEGDKAQVDAGN